MRIAEVDQGGFLIMCSMQCIAYPYR